MLWPMDGGVDSVPLQGMASCIPRCTAVEQEDCVEGTGVVARRHTDGLKSLIVFREDEEHSDIVRSW